MPAPDLDTLYKFEDNIETAVVTVLTALSVTCKKQREDVTRVTPMVSVQVAMGEARPDHGYQSPADNQWRYDMFRGAIRLELVTNRNDNNSQHPTLRATIRKAFSKDGAFDASNLPYYTVWNLRPTGTSPEVETEDRHDVSTMDYEFELWIKPDAWPSS